MEENRFAQKYESHKKNTEKSHNNYPTCSRTKSQSNQEFSLKTLPATDDILEITKELVMLVIKTFFRIEKSVGKYPSLTYC